MNRLAQGAQDTCMYTDRWRPELSRNNFAVENKFEPPPLPPLFPDSHPNPELVVPLCVVDLPRDQEVHPHIDALLQEGRDDPVVVNLPPEATLPQGVVEERGFFFR